MTTYVLLALTDDGRVAAYDLPPNVAVNERPCGLCEPHCKHSVGHVPVREGNDRGQFATFEIAGYSIDVVALPEVKL